MVLKNKTFKASIRVVHDEIPEVKWAQGSAQQQFSIILNTLKI